MIQCQYLIIGSGQTGLNVAMKLASLGKKVILAEQTILGGTYIHNYETPKQLIQKESADFAISLKAFKDNPTTFSVLIKNRQKITSKISSVIQSKFINLRETLKTTKNLTIIKGQANFVSKSLIEINSEAERHLVNFEQCIIAVGKTQLVKPNIAGLDDIPFLYQHSCYLFQEIPSKLSIIGISKESLEVADVYSNLGVKVCLFEETDGYKQLPKLDRSCLNYLIKKLASKQVEFYFNTKIIKAKNSKTGIELFDNLENSYETSHIYIDLAENFSEETLGLSKIGVTVSKKGIVTDLSGRTTKKNILALGECNSQSSENTKVAMIHNFLNKEMKLQNDKKLNSEYLNFINENESKIIKINFESIDCGSPVATLALTENEAVGRYGPSVKTKTLTLNEMEGFAKIVYKDLTGEILGVSLCGEFCIKYQTYFASQFTKGFNMRQFLDFFSGFSLYNLV